MKTILRTVKWALLLTLPISGTGCVNQPSGNSSSTATITPAPLSSPSPTPNIATNNVGNSVTLPVLDALFADEAFKAELKSKLQLTDDQVASLRKAASDEVLKLRLSNAEQLGGSAADAREHATESIRGLIGPQKAEQLLTLAREHWVRGSEELEANAAREPELTMLVGPNAVPKDTRVVVNIPAFRMDVFNAGSLIKSYKIGIGYPEFPLPTGLRKAQTIIFNPPWTPPDEPWVAKMKDVSVGEKVEAGSPLNPLGPIKIPIGMPSLIHGGKPLSKIGTFASHGCVGLTNSQVKDFVKILGHAGGKDLTEKTIAAYLKDPTKTRVVKLNDAVPVELRYETIVVEDGKLHIYRDVYDQDANTEENLRTVLRANGLELEALTAEERDQVIDALNAMSAHPKKQVTAKLTNSAANTLANATASPKVSSNEAANAAAVKAKAERKKPPKNQKEIVIEIAALNGKGYPAPVELDSGSGKPNSKAVAASLQR